MIEQFAARITEAKARSVTALLMPFGAVVEHEGRKVTFDKGSIDVGDGVPVNVDHDGSAPSRIGKLTRTYETDDGLFGEFTISETALGNDVRTLLLDGVITDVSAGVKIDQDREVLKDGVLHRAGSLDHLAVVGVGAFGSEGSRVTAVHSKTDDLEVEMAEKEKATPEVVEHTDELAVEVAELRSSIAELATNVGRIEVDEPNPLERFTLDQVVKSMIVAQHRGGPVAIEGVDAGMAADIERYVLADDTTTTGAGLVPDFQSQEIISIVDTDRAYISEHPKDPIGSAGMSVTYPVVVTKPSVDAQATEKTEVDSTAMDIDTQSHALATVAGASDVSIQLIERSSPSFVQQLFREYAHVYSIDTETRAVAAAIVGAGDTAILADLGADAAVTQAAYLAANTAIIAGVRRPATHNFLAPDRWEQLLSLVDTTGRPLVATTPGSERFNAPGVVVGNQMVGEYLGMKVVLVPDAAVGTCLIENVDRGVAILEQSPQQLRALQVDLLGWNLGLFAYFAAAVKYGAGLATLTLA